MYYRLTPNRLGRNRDALLRHFFGRPVRTSGNGASFCPRVNISENHQDYSLVFELPGLDKGDIKISVAEGVLTVSGTRSPDGEKDQSDYVRNEILYGSFERSFRLPDTIDSEKISADYQSGLLVIRLPKTEKAKPRQIDVQIK